MLLPKFYSVKGGTIVLAKVAKLSPKGLCN